MPRHVWTWLVHCSDPALDVANFKSQGGHVLIGTPGRLDDIIKRCTVMDLRRLEVGGRRGTGNEP